MGRNTIILLNGTSSSGKTTLARAFQREMDTPVLYVSNDSFIFMISDSDRSKKETRVDLIPKVLRAFHRSLSHIAAEGVPIIIDHVIEKREWLLEIADSLKEHKVFLVGVKCPIEELEIREKERGDRMLGLASWQYDVVHDFCDYDYEVDSHLESPESNAIRLKELFYSDHEPRALRRFANGINKLA